MEKKQKVKQLLREIEYLISERKKTVEEYGKKFPMNVSSDSDKGIKDGMLKKMKILGTDIESKKKEADKLIKEIKKEEKDVPKDIKKSAVNAVNNGINALYIK